MNISKNNILKVNKGPLAAILIIALISCISFVFTLFDPTADWDDVLVSMLWLIGLTIAVLILFNYNVINSFKEWVIVALAWGVRIIYATINNSEIITFRGDPFFEMAHGLYYGYNHVINGTYPVITNYPPLLLAEFRVIGINRFVTCYINAFLTMIAIFFLLKCFELLRINKKIRLVLLIVFSFSPFSILWGAEVFREALYLPLTAISLYFYIKWTIKLNPIDVVIAMIAILPIAWLHTGYIVIAVGYVIASFFYFKRITVNRLMYKSLLVVVAILALALILLFFDSVAGEYASMLKMATNLSTFSDHFDLVQGSINSDAGSHYLDWMSGTSSYLLMILYTPIRIFYFLYSPMIWDCYRVQDIIAFVTDSLIFLAALCLIIKFFIDRKWRLIKNDIYHPILWATIIIVLLTAIPFAWGTFNSGTALRHRNCLLPFVCVQIGMCVSLYKGKLPIKTQKRL